MKNTQTLKLLRLLITFVVISLSSCSNQKLYNESEKNVIKPYPHIIDIRDGFNNPSQIKLSEIADSISYIVLSNDKQELIGNIGGIQLRYPGQD